MNCTFYRPATINLKEFENIIGKLHHDLHLLKTQKHSEWSAYTYFYSLSRHAEPLKKNPAMRFFDLAAPESMPSDARVDYIYRPTYIATAFMMKAVLLYPGLMNEATFLGSELKFTVDTVKETLSACMLACTGRDFDGAGVLKLKDCVKLFTDAGADEFLKKYPDLCPQFTKLYREKKAFVESGKVDPREAWYNHGHAISDESEYVWYACYGSNVNRNRFMEYVNRCGDKTPPVEDRPYVFKHSLYFAKAAARWDNGGKAFLDDMHPGKTYGRIYKITKKQFEDVKRMEGSDYTKLLTLGTIAGLPVYSFTDTKKNTPERMPSKDYFSTILDGLKDCYAGIVDDTAMAAYLIGRILTENAFTVVCAIKKNPHYMTNAQISQSTGLSLPDVTTASEWLVKHHVIQQDRRSIHAGHQVKNPEAFFFTAEGPCARDLIGFMLGAIA